MTHPFHPQRGQEYELVDRRVSWGERRLYYYNEEGHLSYIAESWTDLAVADGVSVLVGDAPHFRVEDLLRLVTLVETLLKDGKAAKC